MFAKLSQEEDKPITQQEEAEKPNVWLLCDIDETLAVERGRMKNVHSDHTITFPNRFKPIIRGATQAKDTYEMGILNLARLSLFIETVHQKKADGTPKYAGMIYFTSAVYSADDFRSFIAQSLDVFDGTKQQLLQARFYSAATDAIYFFRSVHFQNRFLRSLPSLPQKEKRSFCDAYVEIIDFVQNSAVTIEGLMVWIASKPKDQQMPYHNLVNQTIKFLQQVSKRERFDLIMENNPELKDGLFAYLENNACHRQTFEGMKNVIPIAATTSMEEKGAKDYLSEAEEVMETLYQFSKSGAQFFQIPEDESVRSNTSLSSNTSNLSDASDLSLGSLSDCEELEEEFEPEPLALRIS